MTDTKAKSTLSLIMRAFAVFNGFSGPNCSQLWWRTDNDYAPLTLLVNINDLFVWASADAEALSAENIDDLEKAAVDLKAASPDGTYHNAHLLWACRIVGQRPQIAFYTHFAAWEHPFFEVCGPPETQYGRAQPLPAPPGAADVAALRMPKSVPLTPEEEAGWAHRGE